MANVPSLSRGSPQAVACAIGIVEHEAHAISSLIDTLSRQGKLAAAQEYLTHLDLLIADTSLSLRAHISLLNASGLYAMAIGDLSQAQRAFQSAFVHDTLGQHPRTVLTRRWIGICLYRQGALDEAKNWLQSTLSLAIERGWERDAEYLRIVLAAIDLDTGNIDSAAERIAQSYAWARRYAEREHVAQAAYQYARLHTLRGDLPAARASLAEAIDLFERLGMRRELAEARQALADLA